ncbi:MAG: hypothetical protein AB1758_23655, partial [Candidatus Eremiobacterota bacterium]
SVLLETVAVTAAAGGLLGLTLGRRAEAYSSRKKAVEGQWWHRMANAPPVPEKPLNLAAAGINLGLSYSRTYPRLAGAGLPPEAEAALHALLRSAPRAGWDYADPWRRTQTTQGPGWSVPLTAGQASPELRSPPLRVPQAGKATLSMRLDLPEDLEPDEGARVHVVACSEGLEKELALASVGSDWTGLEVNLAGYEGKKVQLEVRGANRSSPGTLQVAGLTLRDGQGREVYREQSGPGPEALVDLACCPALPTPVRTRALTRLAALPEGLGWMVLRRLGEGQARVEELPALIDRLPATLTAADVEAAVDRVLAGGSGHGVEQRGAAVVVGGVRVKRKQDGTRLLRNSPRQESGRKPP